MYKVSISTLAWTAQRHVSLFSQVQPEFDSWQQHVAVYTKVLIVSI